MSPLTELVARDPAAAVEETGGGRGGTYLNDWARLQGHLKGDRPDLRASRLIDAREADLSQIEDVCSQ